MVMFCPLDEKRTHTELSAAEDLSLLNYCNVISRFLKRYSNCYLWVHSNNGVPPCKSVSKGLQIKIALTEW